MAEPQSASVVEHPDEAADLGIYTTVEAHREPRRLPADVRCLSTPETLLGESPVWSGPELALYWVDILRGRVLRWDSATGEVAFWTVGTTVGCIGLRRPGELVAGAGSGFVLVDTRDGAVTSLGNPEAAIPTNRLNDGKVGPDGAFWAGSMDDREDKAPRGSLYRLDGQLRWRRVVGGLTVSNGLAWSPDGHTMYHSDSRAAVIYCYDFDPRDGAVGEQRVFARTLPEWGRPDGAAVDSEGNYWSCGVGAGRLNKFDPAGNLVGYVPLPVTHPTMPCFGGSALDQLYVTSMRAGLTPTQLVESPWAGRVLVLDVGATGAPVPWFAEAADRVEPAT